MYIDLVRKGVIQMLLPIFCLDLKNHHVVLSLRIQLHERHVPIIDIIASMFCRSGSEFLL